MLNATFVVANRMLTFAEDPAKAKNFQTLNPTTQRVALTLISAYAEHLEAIEAVERANAERAAAQGAATQEVGAGSSTSHLTSGTVPHLEADVAAYMARPDDDLFVPHQHDRDHWGS